MIEELIERAFCEGYEYAQKEFNSKESKRINNELALKAYEKSLGLYDNPLETEKDRLRAGRRIINNKREENPFEIETWYEHAASLPKDNVHRDNHLDNAIQRLLKKSDGIDEIYGIVNKKKDDLKNEIETFLRPDLRTSGRKKNGRLDFDNLKPNSIAKDE